MAQPKSLCLAFLLTLLTLGCGDSPTNTQTNPEFGDPNFYQAWTRSHEEEQSGYRGNQVYRITGSREFPPRGLLVVSLAKARLTSGRYRKGNFMRIWIYGVGAVVELARLVDVPTPSIDTVLALVRQRARLA